MQTYKNFFTIVGWIGTVVYLTAYTLNSLGIIPSTGLIYGLSNLTAGVMLAARVSYDKNWSNFLLEIFFIGIAIISLINFLMFL